MMYIFNYRIPFLLCDVAEVGGELFESNLPVSHAYLGLISNRAYS